MRKIINSAFVSLDGVTEDPRSWAIFDSDSAEEAGQALAAYDGMLMGRGTYEYFADVMPDQTGAYADAINAIRKYVFSSTLESADWNNCTIIRDDVVTAVTELKQQDGRDLIMYGHGRLSRTLLENDLVDEIRFSVHPVLVGGRAVGGGNGQTLPLKLLGQPRRRAASSRSPTSLPPAERQDAAWPQARRVSTTSAHGYQRGHDGHELRTARLGGMWNRQALVGSRRDQVESCGLAVG
jgi:dihydrofolate reductase